MRRLILFFVVLLFSVGSIYAQIKKISGVVKDESGVTLVGVSVKIKDSNLAVATGSNGGFSIEAKPGDILVFTYIGYKNKEVPVTTVTNYSVVLNSASYNLDDAVVIGYQSIKRKSVTTAISSVGVKDIAPTTTSNVAEALQGKVAGLQVFQGSGAPGAQPKMLVRGFTSITGSSNPLVVVDGVITSFGGLNDINPSDIDKVDVLKDAAATAIYGSRGGAGVILVTTKRGEGKPQVNFSGSSGINHWVKPNLAGTNEFVDYYQRVYAENNQTLPSYASVRNVDTDWWDETISNSETHNYNVSVSTNKNGLSFYGSVGYFNQNSMYNSPNKTGDYEKITGRFNIDYSISKVFKIGINLAPRIENYGNGPGTNLSTILNIAPNVAARKSLEQTNADVNAFAASTPAFSFTAFDPSYSQFTFSQFNNTSNPLASMQRTFQKTKFFGTQGSSYIEIKPLKNLTFRSSLSGFYNTANTTNYNPKFYISSQNFSIISGVSQNTVQDYRWQIDNTVNYVASLGKHHFNLLGGQSADSYTYVNSYVYRQDIPYDAEPYRYISAGASIADASGSFQPGAGPFGKMNSYFSRFQYDYNETYFLGASFRADGSSLLSPENRWGYFPTVSAGYVLSNEKYLKDVSWINYLKLRASFGYVGGNLPGSVGAYQSTLGIVNAVNGNRERVFGYSPSNVPDPNIQWETTQDLTLGIDADFFNNKLSVSFDKYWRSPKDMLLYLPVKPSLGFPQGYIPTVYTNVGNMKTSGYEGTVNYKDKVGELGFSVGLTLQHFVSKATDLRGQILYDEISNDVFQSTRRTKTAAGDIMGQFYGYQVTGVFQNAAQVAAYRSANGTILQPNARPGDFIYENVNGDNKIDLDDRKFIGNPFPKISGGLTLQANYKGFDFRTEFYGSFGNKVANDYLVRMNPVYGYNFISGSQNNYWTGEGTTNEYPRLSLADPNGNFSKNSSFFIQDGSYLRNKLIQLGYTLPKTLFKGVANVRFYASAQNLFTITKYKGLNPEIPFGSGALTYGIDQGQNPIQKFVSIGLNANF
ncbi:SusC/RagA family TonB-linked outer membrane protein [Pedobacter rhizosphaerae]|uniref:TonB-linked outer membrane protein, SusC/RagA family n=1 Tax=Pedobacter rhizosphaerae TaxID=390241 RepID=A0A1H9SJJ1_9SPHI|nr:TonB-dependent receptor [Pedobacter rhizosphaerae]SER85117.1 TonB-linked outer membrane protein, SusC/RagA family [Pedobacter rhizosphaerae]